MLSALRALAAPEWLQGPLGCLRLRPFKTGSPSFQHPDVKILAKALPAPGSVKDQPVTHGSARAQRLVGFNHTALATMTGDRLLAGFSRSRIILLAIPHGP